MKEKKENLEAIIYFFKTDLFIKKTLIEIAPKEEYFISNETFNKYTDLFLQATKDIKDMLIISLNKLGFKIENEINDFFKPIIELIETNLNNYQNFNKMYQQFFSNMDLNFVKEVSENFKGYYIYRNFYGLFCECKTINELLHLFHSYIVNNENTYEKMPVVMQEGTDSCNGKTLYGMDYDQSETMTLSKKVYSRLLLDKNISLFHILPISRQNKIIMMVRDFGHALTLEIDLDGDNVIVHYFIPKICNIEMVNNLKGVRKITSSDQYAKGMFVISKNEADSEIFDFISKVPTDRDMIFAKFH